MLAMTDRDGYVAASVPGLAVQARVPIESVIIALESFSSPDQWSRTKDHDGRRIEEVDGGWKLLNYQKYRSTDDMEHVRQKTAERTKRWRQSKRYGDSIVASRDATERHVTAVTQSDPIASPSAAPSAETHSPSVRGAREPSAKAETLQNAPETTGGTQSPHLPPVNSTARAQTPGNGNPLLAAGFNSPEDFDGWWTELVGAHPNRNKNAVARSRVLEAVITGNFNRVKFQEGYARLKAGSPEWAEDRGRFAPNLYEIVANDLWKFAPPNGTSKTGPEKATPEQAARELAEIMAAANPEDREWMEKKLA